MPRTAKKDNGIKVSYGICFWLFMISNLVGVVIEGMFCLIAYGTWESHVVSVWGPFCLLYGIGTVGFYLVASKLYGGNVILEFIGYALVGDVLELVGGALLEFGIGMKAWDYSRSFMNYRGYICLAMTLVWGAVGFAFARFCPLVSRGLSKYDRGKWRILIAVLSVYMAVDLSWTCICIKRWSDRHRGVPAKGAAAEFIDKHYDDDFMQNRFIEWWFIDTDEGPMRERQAEAA